MALPQQPHLQQPRKGKKKILAKQPGDADPDQLPGPAVTDSCTDNKEPDSSTPEAGTREEHGTGDPAVTEKKKLKTLLGKALKQMKKL